MAWHAPQGVCRYCGGVYSLRLDGALRGHVPYGSPPGGPLDWCPGAWERPLGSMAEQARVEPGQVWADNDWRSEGRTLRVESVWKAAHSDRHYATCTILTNATKAQTSMDLGYVTRGDMRGRKTQIRLDRFRPNSTGYRLVSEAPE